MGVVNQETSRFFVFLGAPHFQPSPAPRQACYLKLGEHQKCVDACNQALELGQNPKAPQSAWRGAGVLQLSWNLAMQNDMQHIGFVESGRIQSIIHPIGSMYVIHDNIYHQYTPNVSIYTIHGSYGHVKQLISSGGLSMVLDGLDSKSKNPIHMFWFQHDPQWAYPLVI